MKVLFFLGAGISYKSGFPSIRDITNRILDDEWNLHSGGNFCKGAPSFVDDAPDELKHCRSTQKVQKLLKTIKAVADQSRNTTEWGETHYEELYDLLSILLWDFYGPPNGATGAFRDKIMPLVAELTQKKDLQHPGMSEERMMTLAQSFIADAVRASLSTSHEITGLDLLREAAADPDVKRMDIATLNHDCLVETVLRKANHSVVDGFGNRDGEIRFFDPGVYGLPGSRIRLFKLHGSLDWHMLNQFPDGDFSIRKLAIAANGDPEHCQDAAGIRYRPFPPRHTILVGQWSKWLDYHLYYFDELLVEFMKALAAVHVVVSSGYGWGDWGINQRLTAWVRGDPNRRLVLLSADPAKDLLHPQHPRLSLQADGQLEPRFQIVPKWLSDTHWAKIRSLPGLRF